MARKKIVAPQVLNSEVDDESFSTPTLEESAPPLTKREAAKARHVSLQKASLLLNRDRNTVMKWLDSGCPYVEKADRDRGVSWVLDLADIVKWLEDRAAKNVADRIGGIESQITEDEAKRRRAVAAMITEETEAAEATKMVARIHDMLAIIKKDYSKLRSSLVDIPEALSLKVDSKNADKVRVAAEALIRKALSSLKAEKGLAAAGSDDA